MKAIALFDYFEDKAKSGKFPGPFSILGKEYLRYGKNPLQWIAFDCGLTEESSIKDVAKNTLLTEDELITIGMFNCDLCDYFIDYASTLSKYQDWAKYLEDNKIMDNFLRYGGYDLFVGYIRRNGMTGDEPVFPV